MNTLNNMVKYTGSMTYCGATSDDKVGIMKIFNFQLLYMSQLELLLQ